MDPLTMAILGGVGIGGLSYFNEKDANRNREQSNFALRQAIARNRPLVEYAMPKEYKAPTFLQKALTGGATGLEMGTQIGLAKKLLGLGADKESADVDVSDARTGTSADLSNYLSGNKADVDYSQLMSQQIPYDKYDTSGGFSRWYNSIENQNRMLDDKLINRPMNNLNPLFPEPQRYQSNSAWLGV